MVHPRACGEPRVAPPDRRFPSVHPRACGELMGATRSVTRYVHPRACGERLEVNCKRWQYTGSSPRVRGTGHASHGAANVDRFIPARAGNGRIPDQRRSRRPVHPRACGERSRRMHRARGPLHYLSGSGYRRFIPARAGNGSCLSRVTRWPPVHPRACGERTVRKQTPR